MNHDSDDVSLPDKLNKLVSYLETHPDVAIVGCFAEYFDDFGNHLGNPPIEHEPNRIRSTFGERNSMINSAALIRREVFGRLAGYKEEFLRLDDYEFFSRALMAGFTLSNIPEVLHRVRLHPNTISRVYAPRVAMLTEVIQCDYIRYQRTRDASLWKRGQIWLSCCYRKWKAHARYSIYAFKSRLVRKKKQRVS
jgi:GT2 family glycosyltransferase